MSKQVDDDELPYGYQYHGDDYQQEFDTSIAQECEDLDHPPQSLADNIQAEKHGRKKVSRQPRETVNWYGIAPYFLIGFFMIKLGMQCSSRNNVDYSSHNNNSQFHEWSKPSPQDVLDSIITKKNRDVSFAKARNDFPTKVSGSWSGYFDPPIPPKGVLELVQYPTVLGNMDAYITPKPAKHGRYPAVIWLSDHFANSIDSKLWDEKFSHVNGTVFRDAGFVVFYPSLRGGNKNPGSNENAYGEVNDVQAACIYLKNREEVDPNQIFLVGHGTGGTLALLTAAYRSDGFRGVLAFGPVARMDYYHSSELNYNIMDRDETLLRSPLYWINDITCKTWVVEGRNSPLSNELSKLHQNNYLARHVSFNLIYNFDHDTIVEPTSKVYIQKIKNLKESTDKITIDPNDDIKVMQQMRK